VKIQGKMTASFENVGQKQGDPLPTLVQSDSRLLYKECENRPWRKNINRRRQYLMCADDVVLEIAVTHNAETAKDVTNVASQIDLAVNTSKIQYMISTKKKGNGTEES
jgi:hypothetical protein